MATIEQLIEQMSSELKDLLAEYEGIQDAPCIHVICPECDTKRRENGTKRDILSREINSKQDTLRKLKEAYGNIA